MSDIIGRFDAAVHENEKTAWERAASHWRLPYWDWAVKRKWIKPEHYGVPLLVALPHVVIMLPRNKSTTLANPLYQFTNPSLKPMGDIAEMGIYHIPAIPKNGKNEYVWFTIHSYKQVYADQQ